jgi:hypothetical protein
MVRRREGGGERREEIEIGLGVLGRGKGIEGMGGEKRGVS